MFVLVLAPGFVIGEEVGNLLDLDGFVVLTKLHHGLINMGKLNIVERIGWWL